MLEEPLDQVEARRLVRSILEAGEYRFSGHALGRLEERGMEQADCINVLRGGVVGSVDLEGGTWRYRFETATMAVVVAFRSERQAVIVTAWRRER